MTTRLPAMPTFFYIKYVPKYIIYNIIVLGIGMLVVDGAVGVPDECKYIWGRFFQKVFCWDIILNCAPTTPSAPNLNMYNKYIWCISNASRRCQHHTEQSGG